MSDRDPRSRRPEVVAFYETKTEQLLRKYGPGPRVHYHSGVFLGAPPAGRCCEELRALLVASQEVLLEEAAAAWDAGRFLSGDVLDAGCGLGGGSLFWAQHFGAKVCAVTNIAAHAPVVSRFARDAGVADRVTPLVCDAEDVPGEERFDAVVSIEAASYFDRRRWFACAARLLRPKGRVFIVDTLQGRPEIADFLDPHWKTQVGTREEYDRASRDAGLVLVAVDSLNERTAGFWPLDLAWTRCFLKESPPRGAEEERLRRSLDVHIQMHRAYADHGILHLRMCWEKPARA